MVRAKGFTISNLVSSELASLIKKRFEKDNTEQ
jgi:hypothetical protein